MTFGQNGLLLLFSCLIREFFLEPINRELGGTTVPDVVCLENGSKSGIWNLWQFYETCGLKGQSLKADIKKS